MPLVIFFLISFQKTIIKKDIGLYRDDGLALFKNASGSKAEKIKKDIKTYLKINT